jgi:hypothetical protein
MAVVMELDSGCWSLIVVQLAARIELNHEDIADVVDDGAIDARVAHEPRIKRPERL